MRREIKKSISGLFVIGMGVQFLLGLCWAFSHFLQMPEFERTTEYIRASENLVIDEYMGILYPLFIAGAKGLEQLLGIPFYCFLYLLQIGAGVSASCFFVYSCRKEKKKVFCLSNLAAAVFLMTVPMVLQCYMAVLPEAFCLSGSLVMLGLCIGVLKRERPMDLQFFLMLGLLWCGMALFQPDYLWLAGLPVLWMLVVCGIRKGIFVRALLISLGALLLILGVRGFTVQPGSYGKIQRSLGATMVSRMVWPNFYTTYFFWPEEIKQVMSQDQALSISLHADQVQNVFGPMVEKAYGKQAANGYYWDMAVGCLQVRTKEILVSVSQDLGDYLCVPWSLLEQLQGSGRSYSGWNYARMQEGSPTLTKWYVYYSLWMFRIGIFLCLGIGVRRLIPALQRKERGRLRPRAWVCLVGCFLLGTVIWYTMSAAGMMDYLHVSVVSMLWYAFLLVGYKQLHDSCEK
ncbi:MAG: hypothetical protein E7293_00360 [Lachnospiraceae bacterium]|nr:hypothetical protein [Lachnospiraceae bacterium]